MAEKKKRAPGGGRKKMYKDEEMVEVGFRCSKSLHDNIVEVMKNLKASKVEASKSDVIRCILEYRAGSALSICKSRISGKKRNNVPRETL